MQTMRALHAAWAALLISLPWSGVLGQQECHFPAYLTRHELWLTDVSMQGALTDKYVTFTPSTMVMTSYTASGEQKKTHECIRTEHGHKVVVRSGDDSIAGYQCYKFIKRSGTVVQIMMSEVTLVLNDDICSDGNLNRQDAPLVAPYAEHHEDFVPCSLHGGYDMDVYDSDGLPWCVNDQLKPRWESHCQAGEGIKVEFRHFDCKARLDMRLIQQLFCLATWEEEGFVFSVVINNEYERPRLWMMRHRAADTESSLQRPKQPDNSDKHHSFDVFFYSELMAYIDEPASKEYLKFHMIQVLYPSLCEDEACSCEQCDENTQFYCQKKCHKCDHLRTVQRCLFSSDTRGEWQQIREEGTTYVRIGQTMMYIEGLLPLQCMQLYTDQWYEQSGRKALYTVYGNGCRPRYNCVEMKSLSPNVMQYRLGKGVIWPYTERLTAQDVCQDCVFVDDTYPINDMYHNKEAKFLVKAGIGSGDNYETRKPVACGLRGSWRLKVTFRETNTTCAAQLNACSNDTTSFSLFQTECDGYTASRHFTCLSSSVSSNQVETFVIAQDQDDPYQVYCWMFHQSDWQGRPTLLVTHPSDCYSGLAMQVLFAGSIDYIARMEFSQDYPYGLNANDSSSCEEVPSSTLDLETTHTTSFFWGPSITTRSAVVSDGPVGPEVPTTPGATLTGSTSRTAGQLPVTVITTSTTEDVGTTTPILASYNASLTTSLVDKIAKNKPAPSTKSSTDKSSGFRRVSQAATTAERNNLLFLCCGLMVMCAKRW